MAAVYMQITLIITASKEQVFHVYGQISLWLHGQANLPIASHIEFLETWENSWLKLGAHD